MAKVVDTLITEFKLRAEQYESGAKRVVSATKKVGVTIHDIAVAGIGVGVAAGAGILALGAKAVSAAVEFDSLKLALQTYTGSAEETERQISRLREVARSPGLGLKEAILGSVRLQAVGFDARLAERALLAVGNALASAGAGKDELDRVILGLSQIASKGKVSAEEINQIAEAMPQVRALMQSAFGTADAEAIVKSGVSAGEFIQKLIDVAEKLPQAMGGAQNSFDNFGDAADAVWVTIGDAINKTLLPAMDKVADFMTYLRDSGEIAGLINLFTGGGGSGDEVGNWLVEAIATVMAGIKQIPSVFSLIVEYADLIGAKIAAVFDAGKRFVNQVVKSVNDFMKNNPLARFYKYTPIGKWNEYQSEQQRKAGQALAERTLVIREKIKGIGGHFDSDKAGYLEGFAKYKPTNDVANDPDKGSIRIADATHVLEKIKDNTSDLVRLQEEARRIEDRILGGGQTGAEVMTAANLDRALRTTGTSRGDALEDMIRKMAEVIRAEMAGQIAVGGRLSPGMGGRV